MRGNMKKNGFGKGFWAGIITGLPIAAIAILILLARNNVQLDQLFSKNGMISAQAEQKITEIQAVIHKYYLEEVDSQTMEDAVSSGLMAGLGDPYAAYYNKEEYEDLVEKNNGNYCGIKTSRPAQLRSYSRWRTALQKRRDLRQGILCMQWTGKRLPGKTSLP